MTFRSGCAFGWVLVLGAVLAATEGAQVQPGEQPDKYQWLEDVYGKRAMDWVQAHDLATAQVLEADTRFPELESEALKVGEAADRIPTPDFEDGMIYNSWQDGSHVRGLLRRTTLSDYLSAKPHWTTVLDFDELGKKENKSWVNAGVVSLFPGNGLCLVRLSVGGEDANTCREFDLKSGQFVKDGFVLPRAKSDVSWVDRDHLLVATDWGPNTLTGSGYPYIVKEWKRGTPLSSAIEVFRGTRNDIAAGATVLNDGQGRQVVLLGRGRTFFETDYFLWSSGKATKLQLPAKVQIDGLVENRLIIGIDQDWKPLGSTTTYAKGSVLSLDLPALYRDSVRLKPSVLFSPTATEFPQQAGVTKHKVILTTVNNVQGRAYVCTVDPSGRWVRKLLSVPDNLAISITSTSQADDKFFLDAAGFITPPSVYLWDAAKGSSILAKSRKSQFQASNLKVEQLWATSKDGTKVPYFIVHRKDLKYDGSNPTLLNAYGGFQVSSLPYYSGTLGKLWLERGGVFAYANIRGGGEFGPAWHDAGLKTHRQRIYDDFAAVGSNLFARKITSPERLGIEGGSNGGLLMGVEMTQHPDMWKAVVIEVPLLDMLRFEQIAAGASWVGEYGSVSVPEERKFLASISPYNQLKRNVTYPEPLIFTTTKDDRVGPVHARKFAARMEEFGKPFYFDEIVEGGHSGGADLKQQAKSAATTYLYLIRKLMD
jgi:prolyl oligopeptidase